MRRSGNLIEFGEDFQVAREEAGRHASRDGLELVPSFHPDLVMGSRPMRSNCSAPRRTSISSMFRSAGSGICGCILARDLLGLSTEIIGVQSTLAPSYALSFAAGAW